MVGKVSSAPPPAIELTAPAAAPAAATASSSSMASILAEEAGAKPRPGRGRRRPARPPFRLAGQPACAAGAQHALGVGVAAAGPVAFGPDQDVLDERRQVPAAQ